MKTIHCTVVESEDGPVIVPDEPLPPDSLRNVYDGENGRYLVYEPGDELPV